MKIKLKTIHFSFNVLKELAQTKFSPKVAYKIGRLLNQLNSHFVDVEKQRGELIKEFGNQDKEGNYSILPHIITKEIVDGKEVEVKKENENFVKFINKFNELLELEIELDIKFPIDLDEINDAKLSPAQLSLIEDFIKKEDK